MTNTENKNVYFLCFLEICSIARNKVIKILEKRQIFPTLLHYSESNLGFGQYLLENGDFIEIGSNKTLFKNELFLKIIRLYLTE